ncbi:MAG: T9SS type A sorting domain-containing protein, partial [candidate division Zixibacteria bacterium]|nr:T9SS type A sorting domain-containing protein [candidate division Zixibacteria bacterium]
GYYWYIPGTVTGITTVALETGVGPAYENYLTYCCFDFQFSYQWARGDIVTFGPGEWLDASDANLPEATALGQNYPNPFNAATTIPFSVAETGNVTLEVYNLTGQLVETLIENHIEAGEYTVNWDASTYSSGVYFYKLQVGDYTTTKKLNLLK